MTHTIPASRVRIPTVASIRRERAIEQLIAAYRMKAPGRQHFEDAALKLAKVDDVTEGTARRPRVLEARGY